MSKSKIIFNKYGENAVRKFGNVISSNTESMSIYCITFPIGFGYFIGFLKVKNY